MAKIINIALNTSQETQVNEHKLKGNVKKHGLFKINVTLQDSIIMKQLQVMNFASSTDKSSKIQHRKLFRN